MQSLDKSLSEKTGKLETLQQVPESDGFLVDFKIPETRVP